MSGTPWTNISESRKGHQSPGLSFFPKATRTKDMVGPHNVLHLLSGDPQIQDAGWEMRNQEVRRGACAEIEQRQESRTRQ